MSATSAACDGFADGLAELALGTLVGRERATALGHVETCPNCRAVLEALSLTADALLQIAPTAEPSVGFESRVVGAVEGRSEARRAGRGVVLGVAAALVFTLGIGYGAGRMAADRGASKTGLVVGHLTSAGRNRGSVVVTSGAPAWLIMTVEDAGPAAAVECRVTLANGKRLTVGRFVLAGGYGEWTTPLSVDAKELVAAELVAPDGVTLASAQLSG